MPGRITVPSRALRQFQACSQQAKRPFCEGLPSLRLPGALTDPVSCGGLFHEPLHLLHLFAQLKHLIAELLDLGFESGIARRGRPGARFGISTHPLDLALNAPDIWRPIVDLGHFGVKLLQPGLELTGLLILVRTDLSQALLDATCLLGQLRTALSNVLRPYLWLRRRWPEDSGPPFYTLICHQLLFDLTHLRVNLLQLSLKLAGFRVLAIPESFELALHTAGVFDQLITMPPQVIEPSFALG